MATYHQELEETNESLEKFAYTAAHDIKTPLSSASGLVHLIELELRGKSENNEIANYLSLLKDTLDRSKQLVSGILEYSRTNLTSTEIKLIDLKKVISKASSQYRLNKKVVINIEKNMPVVFHHETALRQIINNLLSNAIKYNDKVLCEINISCQERENFFEVAIADNGPGITKEDREKVFDLFENLKNSDKRSSGIGLSIVKKILLETGGKIWVEESKNGGAKFIFTLKKTQ